MRLPKFEYVEPKSLGEASSLLLDQESAKILAGGTDLLVNMKHRVEMPSLLINIKNIPELKAIRQEEGTLRIGALTTLKNISGSPLVREQLPALAQAAGSVGSYHHQTMGTLGGNICQQNRCKFFNQSQWWRSARPICLKAGGGVCHVVPQQETCYSTYCGDVAPALMVLGAMVVLKGKDGLREVPLEDLFSGNGRAPLQLKRGEILTEFLIPKESAAGFSTYLKLANRESIDFPIVGTAFWASREKGEYRVAFTAVDRRPIRSLKIEAFLKGKEPAGELASEVFELASKEAKTVKTSFYSPAYKRIVMGLLLQRAMRQAVRRYN